MSFLFPYQFYFIQKHPFYGILLAVSFLLKRNVAINTCHEQGYNTQNRNFPTEP